jgi:leucyl-tRNA synthetase
LVAVNQTIVVQVNGVKRGQLEGVGPESGEAEITALALALPAVAKHLAGREPKRVVYVAGRLLNFVV